jgi:phosphoglycolate phosphatase
VIHEALAKAGVTDLSAAVMVGDRHHDIDGAKAVGISSVGVLYGYGDREEHEAAGADAIAESVDELRTALLP